MIEGLFIAIEGVDGAGTTTQTRILGDALRARGLPVHTTREPSDGPFGTMIRQVLQGRIVVPGMQGARPSSWTTMALLFAADRLDHLEAEVLPNLLDGVTVITDRYVHSSLAYQSVASGQDESTIAWLRDVNRHARAPNLTVVLDVDAKVAAKRRAARSTSRELFDDDEFQAKLCTFYAGIDKHYPGQRIVHVDGNRSQDEVATAVAVAVRELRGE